MIFSTFLGIQWHTDLFQTQTRYDSTMQDIEKMVLDDATALTLKYG